MSGWAPEASGSHGTQPTPTSRSKKPNARQVSIHEHAPSQGMRSSPAGGTHGHATKCLPHAGHCSQSQPI